MKKLKQSLVLIVTALLLSACSLFNVFDDSGANTSVDNPTLAPISNTLEKKEMKYNYHDYTKNNVSNIESAMTIGELNLLVIPVWFSDSSTFIASDHKETIRDDIRKAYFGSYSEIGWHSVKTYYEEESQGLLSISGTVSEWYECKKSYKSFTGTTDTMNLVVSATEWYFNNHPTDSRTNYDKDQSGYIDSVMLIYGAPDSVTLDDSDLDNLWAYCYWLQDTSYKNIDNPGPNTFFWASYDFMYGPFIAKRKTGKLTYGGLGDNSYCNPDTHTYIHEMGHVFGLEDYYDYGDNSYRPAAGFSMQDENVGGHDPYSVLSLGWAKPYIPTESCTIQISAFQKSHDLILLTPEWNENDSPFDEYLLLELYTPTGLNEKDSRYAYSPNSIKGVSRTGIRIWHIDARLAYSNELKKTIFSYSEPIFSDQQITTNPLYDCNVGVNHAFSNSYADEDYGSVLGSKYDNYNILQLIRNNKYVTHLNKSTFSDSDLFYHGSSFSLSDYSKQFVSNNSLNCGKVFSWRLSISISGTGDNAFAIINLNK